MEFRKLKIEGTFEILLRPNRDERGFFMRTFDKKLFEEQGLQRNWVQENHSRSNASGILRGLHFQLPPFSETKLVRCSKGRVQDVFVDLRVGSPTFGSWDSVILSEAENNMVFIPRGFAHGFCTLEELCEVQYKVDNYYDKSSERGLIWNDPALGINWLVQEPVLSLKDSQNMSFIEFQGQYGSIEV